MAHFPIFFRPDHRDYASPRVREPVNITVLTTVELWVYLRRVLFTLARHLAIGVCTGFAGTVVIGIVVIGIGTGIVAFRTVGVAV